MGTVKNETKVQKAWKFIKKNHAIFFFAAGIILGYEIGQDVGYYKGRLYTQKEFANGLSALKITEIPEGVKVIRF